MSQLKSNKTLGFTVKNLGPIREANIDIGDITILMGPPNVGKSYLLKTLYSYF